MIFYKYIAARINDYEGCTQNLIKLSKMLRNGIKINELFSTHDVIYIHTYTRTYFNIISS